MRNLLIRNTQSPGDLVVLAGMIRDLHRCYPGQFNTAVSTVPNATAVFQGHPNVSVITPKSQLGGYELFVAHYPLINSCNQQRKHFLWGFIEDINKRLKLNVKLTEFRPALYLTEAEKATPLLEPPYWVFLSGGKNDFKTKIWDQQYWQQVINGTRDRIRWVQCGAAKHIKHDPKTGLYANMVGKTNLRDFIRLIYHAEGVVCVITAAMHIAAAFNKPCVVIAGGREPWWWEAYTKENRLVNMRVGQPHWQPPADDNFVEHKFLHTMGRLDCCRQQGCWRKKVTDGTSRCRHPVRQNGDAIPQCKAMIKPEMVIDAIDSYFKDGVILRQTKLIQGFDDFVGYIYAPDADSSTLAELQAMLPNAETYRTGSRAAALSAALKTDKDWIVWLEPGTKLRHDWRIRIKTAMVAPCIIGRVYRKAETLYPYPGFFVAHKSLLTPADNFIDIFNQTKAIYYNRPGDYVELSTKLIDV